MYKTRVYLTYKKTIQSLLLLMLFGMIGMTGLAQQFDTLRSQKGSRIQLNISYKNGMLKEIIRMKDSIRDGVQEKFTADGKLLQKINFENGHVDGEWMNYDYIGNIRERKNYRYNPQTKKTMLNGEYKLYSNKILLQEGHYIDSMRSGQWNEYHYTGELKTKATFENDLLVGERKEYGVNGVLTSTSNSIIMPDGTKQKSVYDGPYRKFDLNARPTEEGNFDKGNKEGVWKTWNTGKLTSLTTYKHNKKHGFYETYNDGVLQSRGIFYEEIEYDGVLHKNVYDGKIEQYSTSGKPQRIEHYLKGKKNGITEQYDVNGNLQQRIEYLNNLQTGKSEIWNAKGNKTYEANFKILKTDTNQVSVKHGKEMYWENDQLISETGYVDGYIEGVRKSYSKQGKITQINTFKHGLLDGETLEYYDNGQIKSIKNYHIIEDNQHNKKTEVVGWRFEFDQNGNYTNNYFADSMGKVIVTINYQNHIPVQYALNELLELNYFPDGKLMSLKLSNRYRQLCMAHYYFRNGNTRKISFQNPENNFVNHVDFSDQGEILFMYSDGHQNPDSMKPAQQIVEKMSAIYGNKLTSNRFYTDTVLNGTYHLFYGNGKPLADLSFKQNLPHGDVLFYAPTNSDTLLYQYFVDGIQQGYFTEKFAGRHCTFRGEVKSSKGEWLESFKPDGIPVQKLIRNEKGERLLHTEYYEDGKIKSTHNEVNGTFSNYDKNGMIYYETLPLNESEHVKMNREYYTTTRKLKSLKFYVNDKQDSISETYFESGQLQSRLHYKAGKRNGMYEEYTLDGKQKRKGLFENDLSEGLWIVNDGKKTDSIYFEHGNVVVKPGGLACSCTDTSISSGKLRFVPLVSDLIEYAQLRKLFPPYLKPVDSLHYSSIFCSNLQTSNGSNSGFASMKLLMFKECAFNVPANEQLKITLNPCRTPGYISNMETLVSYSTDGSLDATARFYPKRISIEFLKGPVKSADQNYPNVTAMYDVSELEFNEDRKLNFAFNEDSNSCFTKAILKNYLHIEMEKALPLIFKRASEFTPAFYNSDVNLNSSEESGFFGLWVKKANLFFYHSMNNKLYKIDARSENLMLGGGFASGKIRIPCTKTGTDEYRVVVDQTPVIITSQALKMEWLKKGFTRLDIMFDDEDMVLNLKFFVE